MRIRDKEGFVIYKIWGKVYQRGKMHSILYEQKYGAILRYGIYFVVALAPSKVDEDLARMSRENKIEYIHYPIPDGRLSDKNANKLLDYARYISLTMSIECTGVLSHCNAGRNRSGLMSALILRELRNITGKSAMERVRAERPRAINNQHFEDFLLSLD